MSFSSEYAALRKKRKKNEEEEASGTSAKTSKKSSFAEQYAELRSKRSSSVAEDDDIAPVRNYGTRLYSNGIYTFALDDIAPVTDDRETYAKTLAYRKFDEQQAMLKLAFKKKLEDEAEKDPANRIEQIREANKGKTQEQIKMESQFSAIAAENEAKKAEEEKKKAFGSTIENAKNKPAKQRELENEILKIEQRKSEQKEAQEEAKEEEEKRTWFQAEAFEDGYDFGDVTKSVGATLGDIGVNAFQGLASMGEGIIDFGIYAADLARVSKRPIRYNAQTGEKIDIDEDLREWAQKDVVGDFVAPAKEWLDGASFLGDKSDSVAQGLGQIAGIYLTGGLGEAAGLGSAGVTALTTGTMFASSAGSGIGEAYASGASDEQAMAYGVLKGLADAGSELIFGGLGKGVNALGVSRGLSSLDDMFAKKLSDGISKQVVKNFVEFGVKSSAEGFEEVLAGLGTAVAQKLTYMSDEELTKLIDDQDLFEQFVVGTVTSALAQSGYIPGMKKGSLRESNKTGRDFITGYTQSEQSVIDRVLEDRISEMEESGEELSEKDKKKLLEEVQSDLERGYIDTDVIDEVIGGDSYKAWRDADTKENEILEEYNRLADTPSEKLSLKEQKRRDELDSRIEELRKKTESSRLRAELDNKLSAQLKGSRLDTSYISKRKQVRSHQNSLSYENEADANADKRLNPLEDLLPVREDVTDNNVGSNVQESAKDAQTVAEDDVMPMPEAEQRIDLKYLMEEDDTLPVREDVQAANASEAAEDVPSTTVRKRLETKKGNYERELESNRANRKQAWDNYDDAIAQAQSEYDGLKNKDTKKANKLLRRIDRLKRQQANVDADYEKRISDLEARIGRTDAELQKDHSKKGRLERAYARIDRELEAKKAELAESYERKRAELESQVSDRSAFISSEAGLLYDELANLRRGVRASTDLGYLLDLGYDWESLKAALAHARAFPDRVVNTTSEVEAVVRESLLRSYEARTEELADLENEQSRAEAQLDTEAEIEREKARRAVQRRTKQDSYRSHIAELIGDTSNWRDKKTGLSYSLNTLARNLRDIVRGADGKQDIETADRIYEDLQGTYNHNEAEMNREATRIKKAFADMKITKHENVYAQMLGELRHNPDTELTAEDVDAYYQKHKNKIDTEKVDRIIDMAREVYDSLLERVNAVLREQGMKEIPYRQGYFPHFTNPKQGFLARLLNWKVKDDSIPTDIAGLTEEFKPNRSWQSFNKQRTTDTTDYNFAQGLDTYVRGALDWIYHIEDIQKYRAFETEIRYQHSDQGIRDAIDKLEQSDQYDADELQEQIDLVYANAKNPLPNLVQNIRTVTNILAGKKNSLDRNMESQLNRKAYSVMTNISSRVNANMVVGSLSAALTNFIPLVQSWAEVNPIRTIQGLWQTVKSYFVNDEMVEKSDFLTNRLRQTENLFKTEWDKATDAVNLPMNAIDNLVSQTVWRSKYNQNLGKGMSEAEAIHDADRFTEGLMAGRSRGNMPTAFDAKNLIAKIFTAFQLEVANTYNYLYKDVPQNVKGRNAAEKFLKLTLRYFGAYYGSYLFNSIFNKLTGRNAAFDPVRIVEELLSDLGFGGDDDDEEKEDSFPKALGNLAENILEETPFIGGWLGGGRIPLNSALPYGGISLDSFNQLMDDIGEGDWSSLTKELINPIYYVALPTGGGQLKKSISGLSMFDELPLVGNLFSGVDLPVSGSYTSTDYYKLDPELIDEYDTLSGIDKEDLTDEQKARLDEIAPTVEDAKAKTKLRYPVEDSWQNVLQALLFGKWANENAQDYFENDRSGLNVKQTQEYLDSDMTIQEYWDYRDGLKGLSTLEEQADYINSLDIPLWKKNLFINNIADRKEDINMEDYGEYGSLEEFDFANEYPEKYAFFKDNGISYDDYDAADKTTKSAYDWAAKDEDRYAFLEGEGISLEDPSAFDSEEEKNAYTWAYKNPEKYAVAKAVSGDVVTYKKYTGELYDIKADKDENGKVISGSRKEKVFDYIFGLDLEYGQKAILFKSEYPSDDTFNDYIVDYLNGRDDITYSEMKTILEELGATVDGKSIKW